MTKIIYQSMFYSMSALLLAIIFVMQPTESPEVKDFQSDIVSQFVTAGSELLAGPSFIEPFTLVWSGVESFYNESSIQALAMLQDDNLANLVLQFNVDYKLSLALAENVIPLKLAQSEPLMNIVPESLIASDYLGYSHNQSEQSFDYDDPDMILDPEFNENRVYDLHQDIIDSKTYNNQGRVAGESTEYLAANVKKTAVWMTVNDSITNYPYCVGVFNGTVNSYPGVCAKEGSGQVYEN